MWNGTHTEACNLDGYESVIGLTIFACTGILLRIPVLWLLCYTCSYPTFYLYSILLLSDYTISLLYLPSIAVYLLVPACFMFMIQNYHYTCAILVRHLAFTSPLAGEFWLLWILMSRFWSLEHVDSPSCWSEWRSGSVDLQQIVQSPILPGPLVRL